MRLDPFLTLPATLVLTAPRSRDAVLEALAECAERQGGFADKAVLLQGLQQREAKFPTGAPEGVAFPHILLPGISRTLLIPCLLIPGVPWSDSPGSLTSPDVIFSMFGDADRPWEHLRILARLARIAHAPGALARLRACATARELHERLLEEDRAHG